MSLRRNTPCDLDGICPYESESNGSCEYWCGADEPEDYPADYTGDFIHYYPTEDDYYGGGI